MPKVGGGGQGCCRKAAGEYYDASCRDGDPDCDYVVGNALLGDGDEWACIVLYSAQGHSRSGITILSGGSDSDTE